MSDAVCGLIRFSVTRNSGLFSSLVVLRACRDSAPRPEPKQYHVPDRQGECGDRLRSFVVDGGFGEKLYQNVAAEGGNASVYDARVVGGPEGLHLCRHDLESLFYVTLILATHYEIQLGEPTYGTLAFHKHGLFSDLRDLICLQTSMSFRQGLPAKEIHKESIAFPRRQGGVSQEGATPELDYETLGRHAGYSAFIDPVRGRKGGCEGLVIRYDLSVSTSTAQVDSGR